MKFVILTQYYPPETGAPSNRLHSLARNFVLAGHQVEVLAAMPNYPKMRVFDEYRGRWVYQEEIDGIPVSRSWIYISRSKRVIPRILNYFSFVLTSILVGIRRERSDYLICESPPLFLGISAWLIAKAIRAKLVFNVSDLWPESVEKLGIIGDGLMLQFAYRLEAWLYRNSHLVTGQTQGIVSDISNRFPELQTLWIPNGFDEEAVTDVRPDERWRVEYGLEGKKVFMYAGILGYAQGLEVIVKAASCLRERKDLAFVIIGDGPLKDDLENFNRELNAGVIFIPNIPKEHALALVADSYACIVVLKKLDLFLGAIPSKLFDPLSLGVPILLGVEGEAKHLFIDTAKAGIAVDPENDAALAEAVLNLAADIRKRDTMGSQGAKYVRKHFNRRMIAQRFLKELED